MKTVWLVYVKYPDQTYKEVVGILESESDAQEVRAYLLEGRESSGEEYFIEKRTVGVPLSLTSMSIHALRGEGEYLYWLLNSRNHDWYRYYLTEEQANDFPLDTLSGGPWAIVRADTLDEARRIFADYLQG